MVISIIGIDQSIKPKKLIGWPLRLAMPATITLAEAPISVPLPPKQAPSDRAHQTGIIASRPPIAGSIDFSIGIIVATKGILSIAAETIADTQRISILAF